MKKMYALKHKPSGKLLGFSYASNEDAEFNVSVEFTLSLTKRNVWVVTDQNIAENAKTAIDWFDADFESPNHEFVSHDLVVVELGLI